MKKIVYVITDLGYGGAQTMLLHLLQHIDRGEFDAAVIVREKRLGTSIEDEIERLGIECLFLDMQDNVERPVLSRISQKINCFNRFSKEMNRLQPDVIHAHLESFYAPLYAVFHNSRFIFTIHSFPDRIFTRRFIRLVKLLDKQGKTTLVGCAECVTERAKELVTGCSDKIFTTIYNPIDRYTGDASTTDNNNSFQFVHVARMDPIKNQELLLDAFAELCKDTKCSCDLMMVGDGPLMDKLKEQVKRLGINDKVTFLGERRDVQAVLAKSDSLVLTSNSECCPMCVLEAMASGLPVISTDVGGVREIVGDSGLLVPAANKDGLVAAMRYMVDNPDKAKEMGKRARNRSVLFDVEEVTSKYQRLYVG